jgi:hypothetical protein
MNNETNKYGFIITRHVNSEKTNKYWNHNIKLLKRLYPTTKIVIIDDNSNYDFVKTEHDLTNVQIIQSEFPGRGELLPYYYLLKHRFFENALIIHDSVFIHRKINFDKLRGVNVLPLWFFHSDTENIENTKRIIRSLRNYPYLEQMLVKQTLVLNMPQDKWFGCFGVQSYINLHFLESIERKYGITNLVHSVHNRADRCCLERIFGCIFFTECKPIIKIKSLLGNIMKYQSWGYTYDEYMEHLKKGTIQRNVIKVWTGR